MAETKKPKTDDLITQWLNEDIAKRAEKNIGYNTLGKDYDTLVKKIQEHQKNVNSGAYVSPEAFSTLEKEIADMKKRMSAYGNWIISNTPNSKEGSSAFGAVDNLTQMSNALKGQSSLYADYDENSWKEYQNYLVNERPKEIERAEEARAYNADDGEAYLEELKAKMENGGVENYEANKAIYLEAKKKHDELVKIKNQLASQEKSEEAKGYDIKAGQAHVEQLKKTMEELEAKSKEYDAKVAEAKRKRDEATTPEDKAYWTKQYNNLEAQSRGVWSLKSKAMSAKVAYNEAKRQHEEMVNARSLYDRLTRYSTLPTSQDFAEKSATTNTKWYDYSKSGLAADAINNKGENDLLDVYDAILNNRGAIAGVTSITAPIVSAVLPFLSTKGRDARDRYEHMTDEQKQIFNYLYNTEGGDSAMQYLSDINDILVDKETKEEKAKTDKFVNALAGWVPGEWAEEWVEVPVYAVQGFKSGAEESLPNLYSGLFNKEKPIANSEYLIQALSEDSNPASKALLEIGQSIGNMTPSIVLGTALQAVGVPTGLASAIGAAEMGFQARGSAYSDAIRQGYSKEKASLYATANGALEATLQYALGGIGGVSSKVLSKGLTAAMPGMVNAIAKIQTGWLRVLASGAFSVAKNMGSEAIEEGLQAFLDPYVRQLILEDGDLSKVDVNWEEVGYSALLGALTSGIMGPMEVISDIQLPEVTAEYISKQYDTSKGEDRYAVILENLSAETSALLKQATDAVSQGKTKEAQKLVGYAKNLTTYTQRYIEREGGNGAMLNGTSKQYDSINARIKDNTFNSEAAATVLRENTDIWKAVAEQTDNVAHTLLNDSLSNKTIEDTILKDKSLYDTFERLTGVDLNQYKTLSEKRNAVKLAAESYKTFANSEAAKTAQAYMEANATEQNGATRTENRIKAMSVLNDEVSKLKAEATELRNTKPDGYKQKIQKLDSLTRIIINTVTNIRNHNTLALASLDGSVVINNTSKATKEKSATSENTESVNVSSVTPTENDLQTAWENLPDEMRGRYKLVNEMGKAVNRETRILTEQDVNELNREAIGREIANKKEQIANLSREIVKTKSASEREALIKERGEAKQELKALEAERDALEEYLGIKALEDKEKMESVRGISETILQERITALNKYLGKYGVDIAYEMGGSWYVDTDGKLYSDSEATEALKKGKKLFKRTNNGEATDWTIKIMSALAEGTVPVFTNGNLRYKKVGTQIEVDKAVDIIIGHELVHFVKNNASKQSQDLYKKIINNIKGTSYDVYEIGNRMAGLDVSEEADRKWNNLKNLYADAIVNNSDGKVSKAKAMAMVDEDYIYEEIAANYMGSLMASEGVIDTITETLPTMQKIMMSFSVKKKKDGLKREAARVDKLANALLEASNRVHGREQDLTLKRAEIRLGKANETVERMTQKVQEAEEKLKVAEDELKKNNTAYYRDRVEKAKDNLLEAQENEALAKEEAQKAKTKEKNAKKLLSAETKTTGTKTKTDDTKHSFSSIAYNFFEDPDMSSEDFVAKSYKETRGYKEYVEKCLNNYRQTRPNFNEKKARKSIEDSIDGIIRVAIAAKNAGYDIYDDPRRKDARDSKNRPLFSSLEPNSDHFTSNDISTECDKRKNFQEIYEAIVKKETEMNVPKGKRFFDNVDNYFYIHKVLAEKGLTQPCYECYVECMRKNLAPMANAFIELVGEEDGNNTSNKQLYNKGELKVNNAELREDVREVLANYGVGADFLTVEMLSTEYGLATLKLTKPEIYEAFNSFYGQSKPKLPRSATPFRFGELTALLIDNKGNIKQSLVNKINAMGGFRLQSYSDFQIENYVDVLQVLFEAGTLGLAGRAYTKVPAFLEATEGTNLKRNISIFMYKDGSEWKIDRNDSFPDSLEDIYDIVDADKSGNTGIIAVSQNDDMSAWIMANDHIGYGIPFHKSGLKMDTVRGKDVKTEDGRIVKGYKGTKDHTKQQTEVWAKTTEDHKALTKVKKGISIYQLDQWGARAWDFENKRNLPQKKLIEKNVKAYIDACENAGYIPRFRDYVRNNQDVLKAVLKYSKEFGAVSEDATIEDISFKYKGYTIPYGYYKFLGDFEMFTPDGKAAPQEILSLDNYDFDKAVDFFKDAETLKRNEILQQFANGEEREAMRESNLTAEQLQKIVKQKRSEIADEIVTKGKRKSDSKMSVTEATDSASPEETSAAELVSHIRNITKERKAKDPKSGWRVTDVFEYVDSHPDLNFVDRIFNKEKTAKKDLEAFLGEITDTKTLEDFKWFVGQAYNQKDADYWSETYPYRGASRTFQNAVNKRINEIMSEKVGGTDLGVTNGEVSLDTIKGMFDRLNTNEEIVDLAKRAFATADRLGVNIRFANQVLSSTAKVSGDAWGDMVEYKTSVFNDKAVTDQFKANTILHEIIHTCTNYYLFEKPNDAISRQLKDIYTVIKNDTDFVGQYGLKDVHEMIAELSNEKFVARLKKKNLWNSIVDAIARIFGYSRGTTAYDNVSQILDYLLDNPDVDTYKKHAVKVRKQASASNRETFGRTYYTDHNGSQRVMYSVTPEESVNDFVYSMRDIINKGSNITRADVYSYVESHPELDFIEKMVNRNETAEDEAEAFLNSVNDVDMLQSLASYMEAYSTKELSPEDVEAGKRSYRGATRSFVYAIRRRIGEIVDERDDMRNLKIEDGEVTLDEIKKLYDTTNSDEDMKPFANKVFATAEKLGVNIRFTKQPFLRYVEGDSYGDMVEYNTSYLNSDYYTHQQKANTILHELIHTCTVYYVYNNPDSEAVKQLKNVYKQIKNDPAFKGQYGTTNVKEMVAELSNQKFNALLKAKNLWQEIVDAIAKLFGFTRSSNAYDNAMQILDNILENPDVAAYKDFAISLRSNIQQNIGKDPFGKTEYIDENGNTAVKYSVSPEEDAEYLSLAEDPVKNEARLREMVEKAARKGGYDSPKLYHGSNAFGFTQVKTEGVEEGHSWSPFFAANKEEISASYSSTGFVRSIRSATDTEAENEVYERALEERQENLKELIEEFRYLIDRHISPWFFGQTDNSYLEELVEEANPEMGYGNGVYDYLSDVVFNAFYDYKDQFEEYEDADEWAENSPEGKEIFRKINQIEGEKSAIHYLEVNDKLGGIYEMYANLDNLFVVDCKGANWNDLHPEGLPKLEKGPYKDAPYKTRDVADWSRANGYDGVVFKNIRDNGQYGKAPVGDVYAFFKPESQVKSADPVTYDSDGNIIPLSERFNPKNDDIRWSVSETDDPYDRLNDMRIEASRLSRQIEEYESSNEYKQLTDRLNKVLTSDQENAIDEYLKMLEESEYGKLKNKRDALRDEAYRLTKELENNRKNDALKEEKEAIEKSGLSEADYFRKQAVKEFGYTPYFYDAGYITPNGKMLNFSGEKGKHYGSRGEDHRAIGTIYAESSGTDALNRFIRDGNIRIMAESPGLDMSTLTEPTKEQYATIRKFASEYAGKEFFNVDFTDESGKVIGSLTYENRINPTRIINDIKHFYETGKIREQSNLDRFRYSVTEEAVGGENYAAIAESLEKNKATTENLINTMIKNGKGEYDVKSIPQFIREVRRAYGSKDSNGVNNAYSDAYQYVYNKKLRTVENGKSVWKKVDKVDPETAREMFRNVAKVIFDSSVEDDRASLLREIRNIKISVPNEVKMTFENWNKFRTSNFGKLSLVKDGVTIGEAYAKLNEIAPELFPDSITDPVEQLNTISNEATNLRNEIESEEYTTAEMDTIEAITAELIGGTMALDPSAKHLYETLAETRQYYRERIENIKASKDAWWQDMMGEKLRNKDEKYRLHYEKGINQKLVKDLTTRLYKPTTDKHIPESMRGDIAYILGGLKLPDKPKAYKELKSIIKNVVANGEFDKATFDKFPEGFEKTVNEVHQVDFENMDSVTAHELNQFLRSVMHYINLEDSLFHSSESASYAAALATEQINLSTKENKIVNGFVQKAEELWMSAYDAEGLFNYVGVDELYRAYQEIAKGQDTFASSVSKYTDLMSKVLKENGLDKGVPKEWHTQKLEFNLDGSKKPLLLTQAELMSLYLLEKQEDSKNRLLNIGGGIETLKQGDREVEETVNGKTKKVTRKGYVVADSFKLTEDDLYNKILPKLNTKAKDVADGISAILNGEIANDLNQTSLVVDGYKKFNVKNYFPESVSDTVKKVGLLDKEIEALMTGKSFTKDRTGSKGVPLKINDIFEVYDRHILGASQYIGYEKALRDFNKIYNGTYNGKRLSNAIQNKLGVKTTNAIENFIRSVQGRQMTTRDDQQLPLEKMFGNYKAAKVMLNASVVMKQPTALLRAVPEFSGKGVDVIARVSKESLKAMGDAVTFKRGWDKRQAIIDEMVEHSGLARMKSWGFSEYATAKTVGQLYDRNSLKLRDKANEVFPFNLAERADLYTWSIIWEACKAETKTLEEATDKFNDVIRKTQVVESATTSSPIAKSNFYTKIVFAFKNEPLKTVNYVRACLKDVVRGKEGAGNHLAKALVWTGLSMALTSAITTAFSLGRDDEDDDILGNKDWWKVIGDEYKENFWSDVLGTSTVFLGDIIPAIESALRGREVERADTALVTDTVNLLMRLYKGNYAAPIFGGDSAKRTGLSFLYDASDVVSTITGLPIRTVMRDTKAFAKNVLAVIDDPKADYNYDKLFYTVEGNKARYKKMLTEALDNGFDEYIELKEELLKNGFTKSDVESAVKNSDRFVDAWNSGSTEFNKLLNEAQKYDDRFTSKYVIGLMESKRDDMVSEYIDAILKGEDTDEIKESILTFRSPDTKRLTTEKELDKLVKEEIESDIKTELKNIEQKYGTPAYEKKLDKILKKYDAFDFVTADYVRKLAKKVSK